MRVLTHITHSNPPSTPPPPQVLPIPGCLSSQAVSLTTLALLALTALLQAFAFVTDREWDLAFVVAYAQALSAMILVPLSDILVAARDELSWSQVIW